MSLTPVETLAGSDASDGVRIRSDLLPPRTHGSNIRGIVTPAAWDALRIPVAEAAAGRCHICGAESFRNGRSVRPDCHEKWVFEFCGRTPVQRLDRLVALCPGCHQVQHAGRARVMGVESQVIDRLQQLNGWSRQQAIADLARSAARCRALDRFAWDLDLTALVDQLVVPAHPSLYFTAAERDKLGKAWIPAPRPGR